MCLTHVNATKPRKKKGTGYKLYLARRCRRERYRKSYGMGVEQRLGVWLTAGAGFIGSWVVAYKEGFHVFPSIKDARGYCENSVALPQLEIREVQYEGAHTTGRQVRGCKNPRVIVASRIKIGRVVEKL